MKMCKGKLELKEEEESKDRLWDDIKRAGIVLAFLIGFIILLGIVNTIGR